MTDLYQSLIKSDFSYLKAVAEKWGLPFEVPDARQGLDCLVESLLRSETLSNLENVLSKEEIEALLWLDEKGGREIWDHFRRQFGDIREVGAGRLDRERPDRDPISPVEGLWYRALISRGFFETEDGPQEFVYIPDDLRELALPSLNPDRNQESPETFLCRKAVPKEMVERRPASPGVLDHLCTLLAGLRVGLDPGVHLPEVSGDQILFYQELSKTAGLLTEDGNPDPDQVRDFFELSRPEALLGLYQSWLKSESHQDLRLVPGLEIEGDLKLEPVRTRKFTLSLLRLLEQDTWWSLEAFLAQIRELYPDFQRSGGEYDSWFIKRSGTDEFLRGFENWDHVEGALLRYLLTGPLHWLGLTSLGFPEGERGPAAFQISPNGQEMLKGKPPRLTDRVPELIQIRAKGEIRLTENVPHKTRYQFSRFCDWHPIKAEAYYYSLSPASLQRAEEQGLRVSHLLTLLKSKAESIPPNILKALERWEKGGIQAVVSRNTLLRVGSPAILKALKKSKAGRFILDQIGPTTVIISEGSEEKISDALMELGFFLDWKDQTGSQT